MIMKKKKARSSNDREREKIVLSAAKLIVKKGFLKTSVRDIAEYCGISMGKLYYYIKSKNDILSLFQEYSTTTTDFSTRQSLKKLKKKGPIDALRDTIRDTIRYIDENQDIQVFWFQEAKNLNRRNLRRLLNTNSKATLVFQKIIEKGNEQGVFEVREPALVAQNIKMICEMWATRRWYLQKRYNLDQYIEMQTDAILRIVSPKGDLS
jgi:AcrR family transcriptional regulator